MSREREGLRRCNGRDKEFGGGMEKQEDVNKSGSGIMGREKVKGGVRRE